MSNQALFPGTVIKSPKHTYTIRRVLGQGGFGITYLVDTPLKMGNISFKAKFALKELFVDIYCFRREKSTEMEFHQSKASDVERFKQAFVSEALRLQKLGLGHPNIVKVDEVFEANGTAYYVMEYLEGATLTDYVATHGKRFNFAQTSALLRPICDAVAMLHDNKVAHYDIKPHNIMIQQDDDGLRPVLIDFGLAKHYDGQGQATSTIAAAGYSPGFAPLEQLAGFRQFSPTADVYALAATFVYCLTGHAPAHAAELNRDALRDELQTVGLDSLQTSALLRALSLLPAERTPDAATFRDVLFAVTKAVSHSVQQTMINDNIGDESIIINSESTLITEPNLAPKETTEENCRPKDHKGQKTVPFYRTEPQNLDLIASIYGRKYFFSIDEWQALSITEQRRLEKHGIVINNNGKCFILNLAIGCHGPGYKFDDPETFTWNEAIQWVSRMDGRWRLPTKEEGIVMAAQHKAIRDAIKAFDGSNDYTWCWTCTEDEDYSAWCFDLYNKNVLWDGKGMGGRVRTVCDIDSFNIYRTEPRNLDLQVAIDGRKFYLSVDEWQSLSAIEQDRLDKIGLVIQYNGQNFIAKLTMEYHSQGVFHGLLQYLTWKGAIELVNLLGGSWRIPTKDEGIAMANQYEDICCAIKVFGYDDDPGWWCWTCSERNDSKVWCFELDRGNISYFNKSDNYCVRVVRSL